MFTLLYSKLMIYVANNILFKTNSSLIHGSESYVGNNDKSRILKLQS